MFENNHENIEPSQPKKDYSAETNEYLKYMEKEKTDQKRFSDEYDTNRWSSGSRLHKKGKASMVSRAKGEGLKMLTNKQMLHATNPTLLAQIQAGNNSNNEMRQMKRDKYYTHYIGQKY